MATTNPGAALTNINTALTPPGQQPTDAVTGASFNGTNVLDSSSAGGSNSSLSFVSGFNAVANNVTTTNMSLSSVYTSAGPGGGAGVRFFGASTGRMAVAGTYDLTRLHSTASGGTTVTLVDAQDILTAVNVALSSATNYAATIGTIHDRM